MYSLFSKLYFIFSNFIKLSFFLQVEVFDNMVLILLRHFLWPICIKNYWRVKNCFKIIGNLKKNNIFLMIAGFQQFCVGYNVSRYQLSTGSWKKLSSKNLPSIQFWQVTIYQFSISFFLPTFDIFAFMFFSYFSLQSTIEFNLIRITIHRCWWLAEK